MWRLRAMPPQPMIPSLIFSFGISLFPPILAMTGRA
jgi:hypothetical protein